MELTHQVVVRAVTGIVVTIGVSFDGTHWVDLLGCKYDAETGEGDDEMKVIDLDTLLPYADSTSNTTVGHRR